MLAAACAGVHRGVPFLILAPTSSSCRSARVFEHRMYLSLASVTSCRVAAFTLWRDCP
jgi:hypothetical protein